MGNKSVLVNVFWKFAERITAQLVTLVVSIVLARLLEPSHYGIISIVTIFISIANVFVSDGLGSALIQKKNADIIDFSSVLYFNVLLSIVLYVILYLTAPMISDFYGEGYEILTPVLRVLGVRLILSGINSVQQAYVSRKMIFHKFFLATLTGTVLSAIVGIVMAYGGYGVWALVAQYLTNTTVDTIVLAIVLGKRPVLVFSFKRFKTMIKFGINVLCTKLLITGYQELRALLIGKIYSSTDLAFYDKGKQFPNLIVTNIDTSISSVLFPKLSSLQDDTAKIKEFMRKSIRFSSYIMSPLMLGFLVVSESFVRIILTEKWLPCVPLLQWFCIFYLFQPIHSANTQALKSIGRSDLCVKLEMIRDIIQLIVLIAVMNISVEAIVISMAVLSILFIFINALPNKKLLQYPIKEQLSDILPSVVMAGFMAFIVSYVGLLGLNDYLCLGVQIVLGFIIYVGCSYITRNSQLAFIISILKNYLKK